MTHRAAMLLVPLVMTVGISLVSSAPCEAQTPRQKREAAEFANSAREAFQNGRFLEAADLLNSAYNVFPEPNFVWNRGRAYELAGELDLAEKAYLRYAGLEISEEERDKALNIAATLRAYREMPDLVTEAQNEAELETLRSALASSGTSDPAAWTNQDEERAVELSPWALAGWTSTGLGVAALTTVAILHVASIGTVNEYHETAAQGTDKGKYDALQDTLNVRVVTSQVLLIVGVLLAGGGGTLLYFEYFDEETAPSPAPKPNPADPAEPAALVAPWFGSDSAGLSIGSSF